MTKTDAYIYSSLIIITSFVPVLCIHNYMLRQSLLGRKFKIATMALIYEKVLNLNKSVFAETTVGQMVDLISNDVTRFEAAMLFIQDLWMTPLQLIIVLVLLYIYVGPTGLAGVAVMIGFIPFQIWLSKKMSAYRLRTALKTDERIRIMSEVISGIQVIKMYTWENHFLSWWNLVESLLSY
ncbi:ATP-binding cassette sub-family C member 4-like [Cylas formicarius]|uniref:ATP-binding cassette sub-family C member 4-like n=1 Tax=Cylas formicarius TaxID=197179 RepID=UPI0029584401|nr:ATP-binding cassette sub-family C member 4-like [Cylas formicarius]